MPLADFVHLRVHTAYSLSAGAIRIKELAGLCKAERMPAVAITDSGNLFGALEFATTCSAAGVQPIIGCDIAVERGNSAAGRRLGAPLPDPEFYEAHDALMCIAQGTVVADADRKRLTRSHYFRPAAEMREVFADLPEACDNTLVIARRCAFIPQPRQPILPAFPSGEGVDEETALRRAAHAGLEARLLVLGPQPVEVS